MIFFIIIKTMDIESGEVKIKVSLKTKCSMVCSFLLRTISFDSSLFSAGYSAKRSSGNSNKKWDNFMLYIFLGGANIQSGDRQSQVNQLLFIVIPNSFELS